MSNKKVKLLEPDHLDITNILEASDAFYDVGYKIAERYARKQRSGISSSNVPLAVAATNILLSFELYLKAIILISVGKYKSGHRLIDLFAALPAQNRILLETNFEANKSKIKTHFPIIRRLPVVSVEDTYNPWDKNTTLFEFLSAHSDGFVEWRYCFQTEMDKPIYADFALMRVLHKSIKSLLRKIVPSDVTTNSIL
jgi:HEPN domain-containing protein